ncbi:AAA family ATPase [Desulforhabdus amnigena]|jgi:hypothetical protein|uniref:Cytoplasmic protein n=1 Tax=Desulforhabdus amnigena TaxID=40218 RepID=A0A9W6L977_9BACT|nr:AAA family ATPase [Desulforhabdus amnigena]NLJ28235.1 AAA family ATPase [Deltaproteobacteria bacterium]GLI35354.1 hypothetical protein DAMNIGENAA_27870 [Desulforhabdus amnigena]
MDIQKPTGAGGMKMIQKILGKPLEPGKLGVLMARAGVGKTACLTHIALEYLLGGSSVLHVCIDEIPEKIKVWYKELLKNSLSSQSSESFAEIAHSTERNRFILAYLHHTFNPEKLEQSLQNLKEQAGFHPDLVILDGLDFDRVQRSTLEMLQNFAQKHNVPIWMSARTHRHISMTNDKGIPYPCDKNDDLFESILLLEPLTETIQIKVLKHGAQYSPSSPEVFLNSQTYLLQQG